MAFTKISGAQATVKPLNDTGVMGLPNQPTISAPALKEAFDSPAKQCVAPAVNRLIDELGETTAAANIGATSPSGRTVPSPTVQTVMNKLSDDLATAEAGISSAVAQAHTHDNKDLLDTYDQLNVDITDAVSKKHAHDNKQVLDDLSDDNGTLKYKGSTIGEKNYNNLDNRPQINSHVLTGNQSASDLGLMPATTLSAIATSGDLKDATPDTDHQTVSATEKSTWNGKSVVSYNQTYTSTGQKIGEITIDNVKTEIIAPNGGGGGGGGAVDSVNGFTGVVVLDLDDINDTSIANVADQDTLVYNGTAGTWGNEPLADVALTGAYSSLSGQPTIPDGLADLTDDVAISSPSSGQILQHNGTKWANANMPSIPDGLADLTDDVNISSPSNDQVLKYDGTSSKWVNGAAPAGGHTMLPTPAAGVNEASVVSAINAGITEGGTNDDVASLFGIGKWSNTMTKTYVVTGTGESGVGTWPADVDNPTSAEKATWITIPSLIGCGSNGNIDVSLKFDPATTSTPITLGGYVIDDSDGTMCIKFGNSISSADAATAKVAVEITIKRTETVAVS